MAGARRGDLVLIAKANGHTGLCRLIADYTGVGSQLAVVPVTHGFTYYTAKPREVVGHWRATKETREREVSP